MKQTNLGDVIRPRVDYLFALALGHCKAVALRFGEFVHRSISRITQKTWIWVKEYLEPRNFGILQISINKVDLNCLGCPFDWAMTHSVYFAHFNPFASQLRALGKHYEYIILNWPLWRLYFVSRKYIQRYQTYTI